MLAHLLLVFAMCLWAFNVYSRDLLDVDPEQEEPQPCFPPDEYVSHPGDPPFGVHVQTTAKFNNKTYLIGIQYCEDGTLEFVGSDQRDVSLEGVFIGTGQWWWQRSKSCTQIDKVDTKIEIPPIQCKEPGHWFGNHNVPVISRISPLRSK
jgi:hypothetical protein